jgi:hypothetical protein
MKNLFLFSLLLTTSAIFASETDSLFQRHQFGISMTNGMSHEFYKNSHGTSLNSPLPYNGFLNQSPIGSGGIYPSYGSVPIYQTGVSVPLYSLHLELKYSLGLSTHVRLETGIGYLLQGFTYQYRHTPQQEEILIQDSIKSGTNFNHYLFNGSITIPVHIKFMKPLKKKGDFTCTVGLNFLVPVHTSERYTFLETAGIPAYSASYHQIYTKTAINSFAGGGIDLKMGYEKKLNRLLSVDIGPIVSFDNLFYFNKQIKNAYGFYQSRPYQYYIGLDVAVNFGMKK